MPITEIVSLETYLNTSYERPTEYVDGVLCEKPLTQRTYGIIQGVIQEWFRSHRREWYISCSIETHSRVSRSRFRLPDVVVTERNTAGEMIEEAPILVIEIKSPDDRSADLRGRAYDFHAMGCRNIWLVNPADQSLSVWSQDAGGADTGTWRLHEQKVVPVLGFPEMYLDMDWVWAEVDDAR